jgi:hypothetical protein
MTAATSGRAQRKRERNAGNPSHARDVTHGVHDRGLRERPKMSPDLFGWISDRACRDDTRLATGGVSVFTDTYVYPWRIHSWRR